MGTFGGLAGGQKTQDRRQIEAGKPLGWEAIKLGGLEAVKAGNLGRRVAMNNRLL